MSNEETSKREDHIKALVRGKIRNYYGWKAPAIVETVGPYDPSRSLEFAEKIRRCEQAIRDFLADQSDEKLAQLVIGPLENDDQVVADLKSVAENEIRNLKFQAPEWFFGGLGNPNYAIDYSYWRAMPSLKIDEALCIIIGVEPKHFPRKEIEKLISDGGNLHPVQQYLVRQFELVRRKFDPQGFDWSVNPIKLRKWVLEAGVSTHPQFLDYIGAADHDHSAAKKDGAAEKIDKREKIALAKLVAALAIDGYGYNPGSIRSPIPKEIEGICDKLGLGLTSETIRKYLRLGATHLPDGWRDE